VVAGLVRAASLPARERPHAVSIAGLAAETAAAHGMLQSVAGEGRVALGLVELSAWRVPGEWMDRLRRRAVPGRARQTAVPWPVLALTDREREVLRLLPSRLTQEEIAGELFVSRNTLKFHLRLIYRKLGARSRPDAVRIARELCLLPSG